MKLDLSLPDDFAHGSLIVLNPPTHCDACGVETTRTIQHTTVAENTADGGRIIVVSFLCKACDKG